MISSRKLLLLLAALSPSLLPLSIILVYGIDFPFFDQWSADIAGIFIKAHEGTLAFADLCAQHNEHRILLPRLVFLALGLATRWHVVAEMLVTWVFAVGTSLAVLRLSLVTLRPPIQRDENKSRAGLDRSVLWLYLLSNLLIFTIAQWENWLNGLGLANVMPVFFIMASIAFAYSAAPWRKLGIVVLLNFAAMYSQAIGMLAWPLTGVLLARSRSVVKLKTKWILLAAFILGFAVSVGLYMIGYQSPAPVGPEPVPFKLAESVQYFLAFLGSPFSMAVRSNPILASHIIGLIFLCTLAGTHAYMFRAWRHREFELARRMLLWSAVAWFAILNGLLAAYFRAGSGTLQALTTRYVTFSIYLPIALLHLVSIVTRNEFDRAPIADNHGTSRHISARGKLTGLAMVTFSIALIVLCVSSIPGDLDELRRASRLWLQGKAAVLLSKVAPQPFWIERTAAKPASDAIVRAPLLSALGYVRPRLIATNDASQLPRFPQLRVQGRSDAVWQPTPQEITFSGWVDVSGSLRHNSAIFLTCDDAAGHPIIFSVAEVGINRSTPTGENVQPSKSSTGWAATVPMGVLPNSLPKWTVTAWIIDLATGEVAPLESPLVVYRQ